MILPLLGNVISCLPFIQISHLLVWQQPGSEAANSSHNARFSIQNILGVACHSHLRRRHRTLSKFAIHTLCCSPDHSSRCIQDRIGWQWRATKEAVRISHAACTKTEQLLLKKKENHWIKQQVASSLSGSIPHTPELRAHLLGSWGLGGWWGHSVLGERENVHIKVQQLVSIKYLRMRDILLNFI